MRQTAYPYSSFVLSLITETNEALLFLFVSAVSLNVLWVVSTAPPQNKTTVWPFQKSSISPFRNSSLSTSWGYAGDQRICMLVFNRAAKQTGVPFFLLYVALLCDWLGPWSSFFPPFSFLFFFFLIQVSIRQFFFNTHNQWPQNPDTYVCYLKSELTNNLIEH